MRLRNLTIGSVVVALFLGACAAPPPAEKACTHLEASTMLKRMMRQLTADLDRAAEAKSDQDRAWVWPINEKVEKVNDAYFAGDDQKVCAGVREIAAERHYDVE